LLIYIELIICERGVLAFSTPRTLYESGWKHGSKAHI